MTLGVTGQRQKNKSGSILPDLLPDVKLEDVLRYDSTLNRHDISGKKLGAMALVTKGKDKGVYIATGPNRTDPWIFLHGYTEHDLGPEPVRELDDMVDVELGEAFAVMFDLVDTRIHTKVIETPVLTLTGERAYRCRMTFDFGCNKKETYSSPEAFFEMHLVGEIGDSSQYMPVDHASLTTWVDSGTVYGHVQLKGATTNRIPVRIHMAEGNRGSYHFSFSLEWTSTEPIAEG